MFDSYASPAMKKLALILTLVALTLPTVALAQPGNDAGPDRERKPMRDRSERADDRDRHADRPGDRHSSGRQRSSSREPISVDQLEQAIVTLRAMHPEAKLPWLERIEKLAEEKPEEAAKQLSRYPRLRELMETRQNRPAEFKLNTQQSRLMREVFPLVRQIRQAQQADDQATVDELRPQLRERFEALFQVRLKLKELEIERIREHLQRAEKEFAEIKADSDQLIDEKMSELMQRGEGPREEGERPERAKKPGKSDRSGR